MRAVEQRESRTARSGFELLGSVPPEYEAILSPEALEFLVDLAREFETRRRELLGRRVERQKRLDAGGQLDFLPETAHVRAADWRIGPIPHDLTDRRVEITGPTDRKMVVNALNSGARVFMADFEDSSTPTWDNGLAGQLNLRDAVNRNIDFTSHEGKRYELGQDTATLIVRPRGWHLDEKHVLVDGWPISGSLFDFGLFLFHNVTQLIEAGKGPYFYLPKLESHLEARLWNDVFDWSQDRLGILRGTIKATVLIETLPAVFEMDEILYELRRHIVGLNCGRWDYIFSFIKCFHARPNFVLPDRSQVTMESHFLRAYSQLLIRTCHRRGAFAMGGMAAQIPIKSDPEANEAALAKVRADKEREARGGHDGTWVAHPGLVPVAMSVFDRHLSGANQLDRLRDDVEVGAADLQAVPEGSITEEGLRSNISVGVQYLAAWLAGLGCVPLDNLMEDAATAEISRAQIWQWIKHPAGVLEDGRKVTIDLFRTLLDEELGKIRDRSDGLRFAEDKLGLAARLMDEICTGDEFVDFLTLVAYEHV